jgi:general secretion pathway protein M
MNNKRWLPWISVGSTALVVLFVFVVAITVIMHFKNRAEQSLSDMEPRIARLEGLKDAGQKIGQASAEQKKQLDQLVYDSSAGLDRVGADLQQKIRSAMSRSGLSIQGSQVFTPKPESSSSIGFVDVRLNVAGNLDKLKTGLVALSAIRPRVYVTELSILPALRGKEEGDQLMTATIKISAIYLVAP